MNYPIKSNQLENNENPVIGSNLNLIKIVMVGPINQFIRQTIRQNIEINERMDERTGILE